MHKIQCVFAFLALYMRLAHSWEIAVSADDRLEFYINDTKMDTVRLPSQNPKALAYDEVHNMLLYVDKQSGNDTICGYNMSSVEYNCYMNKSDRDIQGLAFDPITKTLFFTDTKDRSINRLSFQAGFKTNDNGNLLIKLDEGIPTDIAVDSCRGYIYWINTNLTKSTIERARFDGSEREVIIHSLYELDLHSLGICQQTKKIYWIMPKTTVLHPLYSADLNGKNVEFQFDYAFTDGEEGFVTHPNLITMSKNSLFVMGWCSNCETKKVWKIPKSAIQYKDSYFHVSTQSKVGIVANYNIKEQFEGIQECQSLIRLVSHNSLKIARQYEEQFCVHGVKDDGQSLCKCTPGYTAERSNDSVCQSYCLHGKCSLRDDGGPECRCNAGYSGDRCEVNVCLRYCVNNGTCSLDEENEPACQCPDSHEGQRCEAVKNKKAVSIEEPRNAEGAVTLADLLANWRKPIKTTVVVEVKSD